MMMASPIHMTIRTASLMTSHLELVQNTVILKTVTGWYLEGKREEKQKRRKRT